MTGSGVDAVQQIDVDHRLRLAELHDVAVADAARAVDEAKPIADRDAAHARVMRRALAQRRHAPAAIGSGREEGGYCRAITLLHHSPSRSSASSAHPSREPRESACSRSVTRMPLITARPPGASARRMAADSSMSTDEMMFATISEHRRDERKKRRRVALDHRHRDRRRRCARRSPRVPDRVGIDLDRGDARGAELRRRDREHGAARAEIGDAIAGATR